MLKRFIERCVHIFLKKVFSDFLGFPNGIISGVKPPVIQYSTLA